MGSVRQTAAALLTLVVLTGLLPAGLIRAEDPAYRDTEAKKAESDPSVRTRANLDFGGKPVRVEVRPRDSFLPARATQIFLVTVYDDRDKPVRKSKVEWSLDGAGDIVASSDDAQAKLQNRGNARTLAGITASVESTQTVEGTRFLVRPGQSWIAVRSAVEGQLVVTVDCPEMDRDAPRNPVKIIWVDAKWQLPTAQTVRTGTEATLKALVVRTSDGRPLPGHLIRYRIVEGPSAQWVGSTYKADPAEGICSTDAQGLATIRLKQASPRTGVNRIAIAVARPDPTANANIVLGKGEATVTWEAPDLSATLTAPTYAPIRAEFAATLSVTNDGGAPSTVVFARLNLPAGVSLTDASEHGAPDGREILWSLPAIPAGRQATLQVKLKSEQAGPIRPAFNLRTPDGQSVDAFADITVGEPLLRVQLKGPTSALLDETLPFELTVKNAGTGPAEAVECDVLVEPGLTATGGPGSLRTTIESLKAGESRTLAVPLKAEKAGQFTVRASAQGAGIPFTPVEPIVVAVVAPGIAIAVTGPERATVNQPAKWTIRIENTSDVELANVSLRALLPADIQFQKADRDGRQAGGTVEWNLGSAPKHQSVEVHFSGICTAANARASVSASVTADPLVERDGAIRTPAGAKSLRAEAAVPRPLEILGVPALHMEVTDSIDPLKVGGRTVYTIRIRNLGSLAASQLVLQGSLSANLNAVSGSGPRDGERGAVAGAKVIFPEWAILKPGEEIVYRIGADAAAVGEGRFRAELRSHSQSRPIVVEELTSVRPDTERGR